MKLVKILIIIVIQKNLLSVEYVLFLYFYVILIFFEKTRNIVYIYIYTYQSNEIQSLVLQDYKKFEKVSKENP